MPKIRIIAAALLLFALTVTAFATEGVRDKVDEESIISTAGISAAIAYNIENNTAVFKHNENEVLVPGSLTKLMTAVCAYNKLSDRLDETIVVKGEALRGISLNYFGYKDGNTVKIRDLFAGLLTRGYNDSAALLCYASSGSVESFVEEMNSYAQEIGMKDTFYVNPTGLDGAGAATTAADTLIIAREFYNNPMLVELANTLSYNAESSVFTNRNVFLNSGTYFDPRIVGMNVGWTQNSGYCAASAVEGEALTYIIVVLGGKETDGDNRAYSLTKSLVKHTLEGYGYVDVIKEGKIVGEIEVKLSTDADYVTAVAKESLTLYLPSSVDVNEDLKYTARFDVESLNAPVTEGQVVGSYTVSKDDVILGSVDLVTKNSLSRSEFLLVLDSIESFTTSTFFIVTVISAIVLTVLYFIFTEIMSQRRRTRRYSNRRR